MAISGGISSLLLV